MKKIMKKIRKFILNRKIEKYDLEMKDLDWQSDLYHQMILRGIQEGRDENELDKLRLERNGVVNKYMQLLDEQTSLLWKLRRA